MKLYGYPTFRSQKIAIALEELGVENNTIVVSGGSACAKSASLSACEWSECEWSACVIEPLA